MGSRPCALNDYLALLSPEIERTKLNEGNRWRPDVSKMCRPVMVNAEQTPQYADVRNAGHDGSDFLFVRKK